MTTDLAVIESTGEVVEVNRAASLMMDPRATLDHVSNVAAVLKDVLVKQGLVTRIQGRDHVNIEGWTLLAQLMGHTVGIESDARIEIDGAWGWEATAVVYREDGTVVSRATSMCLRSESTWANRDEFAVRSMAQTRARSKALQARFDFIVDLAGYKTTPESDMPADLPADTDALVDRKETWVTAHHGDETKAGLALRKLGCQRWEDLMDEAVWERALASLEAGGEKPEAGAVSNAAEPNASSDAPGSAAAPGQDAPVQGVLQDALDKRAKEKKA